MKNGVIRMLIVLLLVNSLLTKASIINLKSDDIEVSRQSEVSAIPSYIQFEKGKEPLLKDIKQWLVTTYNLNSKFDFILLSQEADQLGYVHYRYQQVYDGIPIEGSRLVTHTKQGYVYSLNGLVFDGIGLNSTSPKINEKEALITALNHVKAEKYKWENPNSLAIYYPKAKLVYTLRQGKLIKNNLCLAYQFDIYASKPLYRAYVYVDAITNKIVNEQSRIHFIDVPGTANTAYSGTQSIVADSYLGAYRLRETGRGNGIETYNLQQGTDFSTATDFVDANNIWNNINIQEDQYATDAHWGTEKTYDFYMSNFNRNSIDNSGFKLISYMHYNVDYFNAFWDGNAMTYGDGGSLGTPLVPVDIVGHEIAHGLTQHTAGLIYNSESGGLNESFSDVFGTSIEFYAKPGTANWLIGDETGYTIRSMQNPNAYGNPDTYHGLNWDPNEEVHNISGVQNFWFYLLSVGGSGTNDIGNNYNVSGIGINNAAKIAYRNLTVYLTPSSNYADARYYAIQSAMDLFGPCSPEVAATANAWYAVGIGGLYSNVVQSAFTASTVNFCSIPAAVNFTNNSSNGVNFLWYFGDGTTGTQVNPTHTYNNFGMYSVKLITYGGTCGTDSITKTNYISIDSFNVCPISVPFSGSLTQTTCSGVLVDDGGTASNYSTNSNGTVTLAPSGATQIVLTFSSFDFESGWDFLNIYAGPNNTFPLYGAYTGSSLPGGGSLTINSGVVTIQQITDGSIENAGFELAWQCNTNPVPPIAYFKADSTISCSGTISFTDMSLNAPTSWLWNFGDGSTSSLQNPVHYYSTNGIYSVSLQATNGVGANSYTISNYINVNTAFCNGILMPTGSGAGTTQTSCFGLLYDDGGAGGNYSVNTNSTIVISPVAATQITVNFSLFDFENGYDFVEIYNGAVISPGQMLGHYTGNTLPGGGVLTFYTGIITILQHSDAIIVGQGFIMDWSCSNVPVFPMANFMADSTSSCSGLIHFYDFSSGAPTSWLWNFGDGTTSTAQNPVVQYTSNGIYDVSLQVTNGSGSNLYNAINYIRVNDVICSAVSMPGAGYGANLISCAGVLVDNGGAAANYSDNTNSIVTIVPAGATQITLHFSLFDMETNYDSLFIYAGASVTSPLVGSYTGNTLPGGGTPLVVSAAAVTIKQTSDYSVNKAGFEMNWTCNATNGIKDYETSQNNMILYPNPVRDAITIIYSSKNSKSLSVTVSDPMGKKMADLVIDKPMNEMYKTTIDISEFTNGVYFVEIKDGLKSITRKFVVIK